jgi:hypothetical protein
VADGRYLSRGAADSGERVLVIETLTASPAPSRRRRRPRPESEGGAPPRLPLARATAIRAHAPFDDVDSAQAWLRDTLADDEEIDRILEDGIVLLNRALHAQAAATLNPRPHELSPRSAIAARIGFGSGDEVAGGRFTAAERIDVAATGASIRGRRSEELRPQERVAAVLGGRERVDACETLLLRARADLDAGRVREAALQLWPGLEAALRELDGTLADPAHTADMATLRAGLEEARAAARSAIEGELEDDQVERVEELAAVAERVLRRRRVLRGG